LKATLTFNLPEEKDEFETAARAASVALALDMVWQRLFRPFHKHGYPEGRIDQALKANDCEALIDALGIEYQAILDEYDIPPL